MGFSLAILESFLLSASGSLDAFAASFSYGMKGIKIPLLSNQIINVTCSVFFGLSLLFGSVVRRILPEGLIEGIAFAVLFLIGLAKSLDSVTKSIIRRHYKSKKERLSRELKFTLFHFSFILNLYANPEEADMQEDRIISPKEAVFLALSLSLDGVAIGFGAAMGSVNIPMAFFASLITNMTAVFVGCRLGNRLSRALPFSVSWLSGVILMGLAVAELL